MIRCKQNRFVANETHWQFVVYSAISENESSITGMRKHNEFPNKSIVLTLLRIFTKCLKCSRVWVVGLSTHLHFWNKTVRIFLFHAAFARILRPFRASVVRVRTHIIGTLIQSFGETFFLSVFPFSSSRSCSLCLSSSQRKQTIRREPQWASTVILVLSSFSSLSFILAVVYSLICVWCGRFYTLSFLPPFSSTTHSHDMYVSASVCVCVQCAANFFTLGSI